MRNRPGPAPPVLSDLIRAHTLSRLCSSGLVSRTPKDQRFPDLPVHRNPLDFATRKDQAWWHRFLISALWAEISASSPRTSLSSRPAWSTSIASFRPVEATYWDCFNKQNIKTKPPNKNKRLWKSGGELRISVFIAKWAQRQLLLRSWSCKDVDRSSQAGHQPH